MRVVNTDNFGGDYPNESFVGDAGMTEEEAKTIADELNKKFCDHPDATRFWKVVPDDYKLRPGFEP